MAITAETTIKKRMNTLITATCLESLIFSPAAGLITSRVNVELDVRTSDESVDIEAERTSTITTAITIEGSVDSIDGTIVSKSGVTPSDWYEILSA